MIAHEKIEITLTEYMNRSIWFRGKVTTYCIKKGNNAQETRDVLHLLDALDNESEKNVEFRYRFYVWLYGGTGTLELRDMAYLVGFDYWDNIKNSNIIDTFDSYQGYI